MPLEGTMHMVYGSVQSGGRGGAKRLQSYFRSPIDNGTMNYNAKRFIYKYICTSYRSRQFRESQMEV